MANGQYQNVNGVKTLNLHGKNYVEVAERVHMVHEKKAVFSIVKSEPVNVADRWLWVAVVMVDGQQYIGNAEIKMNAAKNTPDGTNPFECGETSAIGRALAFAGFGSVESIASKDEIERSKPFNGNEQAEATSQPAQAAKTESKPADPKPLDKVPTMTQIENLAKKYHDAAPDAMAQARAEVMKARRMSPVSEWTPEACTALYEALRAKIKAAQALAKAS